MSQGRATDKLDMIFKSTCDLTLTSALVLLLTSFAAPETLTGSIGYLVST